MQVLIVELDPQETVEPDSTTDLAINWLLSASHMTVNPIDLNVFHLPFSNFVDFPLEGELISTLNALHPHHGRLANRAFGTLKLLGVVTVDLRWHLGRSSDLVQLLILRGSRVFCHRLSLSRTKRAR